MTEVFERLRGKLVVSCQAYPGDPLEDTDALRRMALAALSGGAAGLRLNGAEHIAVLRRQIDVPIIGIEKRYGSAGLRITPDFAAAARLASAGASIIALDCTGRAWPGAEPWREIVARVHRELRLPVMADVSTLEEAMAAEQAGVDCIGTTLFGYTEHTAQHHGFSWPLLEAMRRNLSVPIMAEGHLSTPGEARRAIEGGAWCVVIGSAITRPGAIAAGFARALVEAEEHRFAIGVDIGGTAIKAGVMRRGGELLFSAERQTRATLGRDAILAGFTAVMEEALQYASREAVPLEGVGIATAGAVDPHEGSIFAATDNLPGWAGFPLRAFAEERFALQARVVNDAQAAALCELRYGAGRGLDDLAVLTLGTGVGGGFTLGRRLVLGRCGFAGSVGHMVIRAEGLSCNCGRKGCLEAYVSTAALARTYRSLANLAQTNMLAREPMDDAALAFAINRAARAGDASARAAYSQMALYLAEAVANLYNLLDPQAVILTGGLIEGLHTFAEEVQQSATRLLHFGEKRKPRVLAAAGGRMSGVRGAASLLLG